MLHFNPEYIPALPSAFASLAEVFSLAGTVVSTSKISEVIKYELQGRIFYVKRFHAAGKHLRKYLGRSRIRAEWENLKFCQDLQINVPTWVSFGEKYMKTGLASYQGVLITEAAEGATDLLTLAHQQAFKQSDLQSKTLIIVADYLRRLHDKNFVHYDLRWRNILVSHKNGEPVIYFFDMPNGKIKHFLFKKYYKRDFYCLAKDAIQHLSRTQCLRFYLRYKKCSILNKQDKKELHNLLIYFKKKGLDF